jgi:quinol monooxygenase YgiN
VIIVSGRFRLPPERLAEARPAMEKIIAASVAEPGCRTYSYSEDIGETGLIRVYEEWESREALDLHFAAAHMKEWQETRAALGFHDRSVAAYDVNDASEL